MSDDLREPLRKKVGGSLSSIPPFERLEAMRCNLLWLQGKKWSPPAADGTHVRKVVGKPR